MDKKILIFDFDGVIIDSFKTTLDIGRISDPDLTEEEFRHMMEGNVHDAELLKDRLKKIAFFDEYSRRAAALLPIPGVSEEIKRVNEYFTLTIVSSTPTPIIHNFLEQQNLRQYFEDILGGDVHTSKVTKFNMLFEHHGITTTNSLFITDTLGDLREANEVNLPSIAVTWGYHDEALLTQGNPVAVVSNPTDLSATILKTLGVTS